MSDDPTESTSSYDRGRRESLADFIIAKHRRRSVSVDTTVEIPSSVKKPKHYPDDNPTTSYTERASSHKQSNDSEESEPRFHNAVDVIRYRMQKSKALHSNVATEGDDGGLTAINKDRGDDDAGKEIYANANDQETDTNKKDSRKQQHRPSASSSADVVTVSEMSIIIPVYL